MRNFERNLLTEWRRLGLPKSDCAVVIAVSGGADSMSLAAAVDELHVLKKLSNRPVLAHFNHRLRGDESEGDELHVRRFAEERGLELAVGHATPFGKGNLEEKAREARYAFLEETAGSLRAHLVLTAHTVDDQAETFLMNLIRGAGPHGLSGMPCVREFGKPAGLDVCPNIQEDPASRKLFLVRPMLAWARRSDAENYCHEADVGFRYDSMNEDLAFMRVRVRKLLIPMLREFNPRITETLARTADLQRFENTSGDEELHGVDWEAETLQISDLKDLPREGLMKGLRMWLGLRRGGLRGIGMEHIEAIADLVTSTKSGRLVEIPGKMGVVKTKGLLQFRK